MFGVPIVDAFDSFLSRRVLSHRLDVTCNKDKKRRYLFLNNIEQWQKFEEYVRSDAEGKTILQTDLQNYYENIRIHDLHGTLLHCLTQIARTPSDKASLRFCIDSICRCLKSWSYDGTRGLPQNRDISSFLANIYLSSVDTEMIANCDYYRYMDEIRCSGLRKIPLSPIGTGQRLASVGRGVRPESG
jgi:hypothetical protein